MNRIHYANAIADLNVNLLKMSVTVEEALNKSISALRDQNPGLAEEVIRDDDKINDMEMELFDTVTTLMATEQPVAGDLRHLIGAIRIITDLERAGDYAVHIAKGVIRLQDVKYLKPLTILPEMAETATLMLKQAIEAFMNRDVVVAKETAKLDNEIDNGLKKIFKKLLPRMKENPDDVDQALELVFLGRYLERLGDHVVNICEWVIYTGTGDHVEL
ncbi:MAG: phosphate signaling complex protein PhoU [Spirochaetales bacterium]|nr:phosphate signaling complex protein PhoU [Spirochaetales bacterium]